VSLDDDVIVASSVEIETSDGTVSGLRSLESDSIKLDDIPGFLLMMQLIHYLRYQSSNLYDTFSSVI